MAHEGAVLTEATLGPSRRKLIGVSIGASLVGALWTTGLAALSRGRHPQVFVVGEDAWAVALIEHGTSRIALLCGTMERSLEPEIDRLCGLLRQHIDIVIGTASALALLSSDFRNRRSVTTIIQLDGSSSQGASSTFVPLTSSLAVRAGRFSVELRQLASGLWDRNALPTQSWIGHIQIDGLAIAIAPSLETIARNGPVGAALAVAPLGSIRSVQDVMPGVAIATNGTSANRASFERSTVPGTKTKLVRLFPEDIATFVIRDRRVILPEWTQSVAKSTP